MNRYLQMAQGLVPAPAVFVLLGGKVKSVNVEAGTLELDYQANPSFTNPSGTIQGGMLCCMLDDLTAGMVDATLQPGQGVATLALNTSFLRAAQVGPISGRADLVRKGRDICHVSAVLEQNGTPVASATAICKIVSMH